MKPVSESLLYAADQSPFFAYFYGNDIAYRHGNIGHHLAIGNQNITTLASLREQLKQGKILFGHFSYETERNVISPNIAVPTLSFFEPEQYFDLQHTMQDAIAWSKNQTPPPPHPSGNEAVTLSCNFSETTYAEAVEHIRNHIEEGDCYELNLCMEFSAKNIELDPIQIYLKLNELSPMPFSALYKVKQQYLICASPERFIKKEGDTLISQPIKGTIRKGATEEENKQLQHELLHSKKERAENLMIVDLVRNDLARSAESGSVKVEELFGIYDFARVNQMISTVTGTKKESVSNLDAIMNAFPMGSMTGAPKVKVMELIEQYEQTGRGIYSGTVGFFNPNEDFDFNVVIRSIVYDAEKKKLSFHVGSAITYDSVAREEYKECLLKANAIMDVLGIKSVVNLV